jgi:hypothetical protein
VYSAYVHSQPAYRVSLHAGSAEYFPDFPFPVTKDTLQFPAHEQPVHPSADKTEWQGIIYCIVHPGPALCFPEMIMPGYILSPDWRIILNPIPGGVIMRRLVGSEKNSQDF